MQEIFQEIPEEIKTTAQMIWQMALTYSDPTEAAEFLNTTTNYCKNVYTEAEVDFIRFYIGMKLMEMMKE